MSTYTQAEMQTTHIIDRYIGSIPPLPIIVAHALQLNADDDVSVLSLTHALEADPAITAKLLRAANSAFYGLVQRVYTVRDAILIVGFDAVRSLAVTMTVVGGLWVDDKLFDRQRFWRHSLRCGLFAKRIATILRYPKPDIVFTLGVLHDVGRTAIIQMDSAGFGRALELMKREGMQLWRAEQSVLGIDHAEIGGVLASHWMLPPEYADAIKGHHNPAATAGDQRLPSIVALADSLAHSAAPSDRQGYITPALIASLWEPLGLTDDAVRQLLKEKEYFEEITRSLYETAVIG